MWDWLERKTIKKLLQSDLFETFGDFTIHGLAFLANNKQQILANQCFLSNKLDDMSKSESLMTKQIDQVCAVHCPSWPVEVYEWITRRRCHNFPSKSLIKQVYRYGRDLVNVSHKLSNNSNEWRYSFSKVELIIIKSWTVSQVVADCACCLLC